jgi:hypothetical protein
VQLAAHPFALLQGGQRALLGQDLRLALFTGQQFGPQALVGGCQISSAIAVAVTLLILDRFGAFVLTSVGERLSMVLWTTAGLLLFGPQLLFSPWALFGRTFFLYDQQYLPAYPILLILLIGYGAANIFFWNRPLLLAQGRANLALRVGFWAMLAKVALGIVLLPRTNYLVEAGLLSGYFLISVGWMVYTGLAALEKEHKIAPAG